MNFRKNSIALAISGTILSGAVSATPIDFLFDLDGVGAAFAQVQANQIQLDTEGTYMINQDLGGDGELGNGDTFTESFRLSIDAAQLNGTDVANYAGGAGLLSSFGYIDVTLVGEIFDFDAGIDGEAGSLLNPGAVEDDVFAINVTSGSLNFYFDADADRSTANSLFASSTQVDGGATAFSFENPSATAALGVSFLFDTLDPAHFLTTSGDDFSLSLDMFFGFGDGSVNLEGVTVVDNSLLFEVSDNGTTLSIETEARVPEPATLTLLGTGLLCAGFMRKKKQIVRS